MKFKVTSGTHVLEAAASVVGLDALSVAGGMLVFDFGENVTLESAVAEVRKMDAHLSGLIADATTDREISVLSALKAHVCGIERDVMRELTYNTHAHANVEPNEVAAGSHLHADQNASTYQSSSSTNADLKQSEEVSHHGKAQEQRNQPRRRSRK